MRLRIPRPWKRSVRWTGLSVVTLLLAAWIFSMNNQLWLGIRRNGTGDFMVVSRGGVSFIYRTSGGAPATKLVSYFMGGSTFGNDRSRWLPSWPRNAPISGRAGLNLYLFVPFWLPLAVI